MSHTSLCRETIKNRGKALLRLSRVVNLFDSDAVAKFLNNSSLSAGSKNMAIMAYKSYLSMIGLPVPKMGYYRECPRLPYVPLERELDELISGARHGRACFLKLLKDTGLRPIEAWRLRWIDLDTVQKTVNIPSTKRGYPRKLRVTEQWLNMISRIPRKHEYIFSKSGDPDNFCRELESCARNFTKNRKRLADKLQNPRLKQISLYTFRHWKATTEYLRTRDIFHVKEFLGHKQINTTLKYIHVANMVCSEEKQFTCKAAKTESEASMLIESGFDYVTSTMDGLMLFRKPK